MLSTLLVLRELCISAPARVHPRVSVWALSSVSFCSRRNCPPEAQAEIFLLNRVYSEQTEKESTQRSVSIRTFGRASFSKFGPLNHITVHVVDARVTS